MRFPFLQRARWVTDKYILLMLGVFPLFVGIHGYNAITESKFWFFAVATCAWALTATVLLVCGLIGGERYSLDVRPAHLAIGAFLAVSGISACLSEYIPEVLAGADRNDGYLTMLMYALAFYGISMLGAPRRRYAWALGFSSTVCCVIAVLQLFGLDPFWFYPTGTNYYDKYVAYNSAFLGTMGNTGVLASFLCVGGGFLPVYGALSPRRADRLLLLPAALTLAMIALIDVDAGVVAILGGALIAVPVVIRSRRAGRLAGCASAALTAGGLTALWFWPGRSGTLYEMSQVLHGHLSDEFGSRRGEIWKASWRLFLEKPWLGGGPGTTKLRYNIRWYSEVRDQTVAVMNAHNAYLGYLVNVGILGLLAYLSAIVCSLVTWFKRRRDGAMYPALGAAFVCYLIQDFFGLNLPLSAPLLWVIWGLLESRPPADAPEPAEVPAEE